MHRLVLGGVLAAVSATLGPRAPPTSPRALPLLFVENAGQTDPRVAFTVAGLDTTAFFTDEGVTWTLRRGPRRWAVRLDFADAARARPEGLDPAPTRFAWFRGPRAKWRTGVRSFRAIAYREIWPEIDLVVAARDGALESEFHVRPGADPARVAFVARVRADGSGLEWSGFLGGAQTDIANAVALDGSGAPYVAGWTASSEATFPVSVGPALAFGGGGADSFVAKVLPDGTGLAWCGYSGVPGGDWCNALAVDSAGRAILAGRSAAGALGGDDVLVGRTRADGSAWADLMVVGGSGNDAGRAVAIDPALPNAVAVAGSTASSDVAGAAGFDSTWNGATDALVEVLAFTSPPTIDLAVTKGDFKDTPRPGRDVFKAKGTLAWNESSPDGAFDPATDAVDLALGDATDPIRVAIAAGDAGWRERKGKATWRSAKGARPRVSFAIDPARGTFKLSVKKADCPAPPANPLDVRLTAGDDWGVHSAEWTARGPGRFRLRP